MNPNRTSLLAALLVATLTGCINLPDIDSPSEPKPPDTQEPEPQPDLIVRLLSPTATAYTNGAVDVSIEVTNGTAEAVDLFAGPELLTTLTAPYTFRWDTATKPEGSYTLVAKARRGTQSFTSDTRTVVVDRTPPQVVVQSPTRDAQQVSVRQPIYVQFAEPLKPASVTDATVRLTLQAASNPVELAKTLTLSADGTALTITPNSKPGVPSEVSVTLLGVTDLAGNAVSTQANTWGWSHPEWVRVGDPLSAWPHQSNGSPTPAEFPSLALDDQGNSVVAWSERPLTATSQFERRVLVQRWNGTAWQAIGGPIPDESSFASAGPPSLELDDSGRPVIACRHSGSYLYINKWEQGTWQEMGRVWNGRSGTGVSSPSLHLDGAGYPAVAWSQTDSSQSFPPPTSNVYFSRWTGAEWTMVNELSALPEPETNASSTVLKIGSLNKPVVAWREFDGAATSIHVWGQHESGWQAIGAPLRVNPGAAHAGGPSLQLTTSGYPVVAWSESDAGSSFSNIYVRRWTGSAWESLGNGLNSVPGITKAYEPSLVVNAAGNPIVAWVGYDGTTANIHVHQWKDGSWEPLGETLSANPGATDAAHPSLRIDPEGIPVLAWDEAAEQPGSNPTRNVYVYRFNQ
ncbi:MAG TPA: Ig-like domain-containing protein [Myxococcaceae bacterium]|jgi:hypothetical protein